MTRDEARRRAEALVSQMTLEEKASQIRFDAPAIERLNIPEYNWWGEALHGVARAGSATMFPQAIGMAASFDTDLLEEVGDVVATEARAKYNAYSKENDRDIYKNLTLWSPNVNIFRDPRWGRGHETYGEDPYLTGEMGKAYIKGLQGDGEYLKIAACAKHMAVHSGPEELRHEFDAKAGKKDLYETYLPAFEKCVKEADVEAVMGAYNRTNGEPCCAHKVLMQDILRGEWQFEGHFVSDCWAIKDFHTNHHVTNNAMESVALALSRGCDVNCGDTYRHTMAAYDEGLVSEEEITNACVRLFTTRFRLGMFDKCEYDNIPYNVIECREHRNLAKQMARESIVLLKNEDSFLPLDKSKIKTIGIIGPNANSRAPLMGNYHGTATRYTTVSEGITGAIGDNIDILYSEGCHLSRDRVEFLGREDDRISEAVTVCKHSDVVVLVLGLDETLEGEEGDTGNGYASGDKEGIEFPIGQKRLLEAVAAVGKDVILVNMTGSAMDLSIAKNSNNIKAILQVWYPGAEGGEPVAQAIFGDFSPSGKLPVTFYNSIDELPDFTDYSMKGRTYRYFEQPVQYPFGFGLTYGKMEIVGAKIQDEDALKGDFTKGADVLYTGIFNVCVSVKNDSNMDFDEVLQVYIKNEESKSAPPNACLWGFKRGTLKKDSITDVIIPVSARGFLTVDEEGRSILDSKRFTVSVGVSQPDSMSVKLCGVKPVSIEIEV